MYVVEGEKDVEALRALGLVATCNPGGAGKWRPEYNQAFAGKHVVILPHNDEPGEQHGQDVARSLLPVSATVKVVRLPGLPPKGDVSDWLDQGHTKEELESIVQQAVALKLEDTESDPSERRLRVVSIGDLLALDLKPRDMVLAPILPTQGLVMVHSWRGVGKTLLSVGVSYAVACGATFLKWQAPKARRVLYVDGELPGTVFQERLASQVAGSNSKPPNQEYFQSITPDLQACGIPDLATKEGQALLEDCLDGIELLILDNLSTLFRSGEENAAESWLTAQEWLLSLRRHGLSVLLVHHSGKTGVQRGTSRREDVLDTVLCLKHPKDYKPSDGARFEVHFEKCRGLYGPHALPFEAKMETLHGKALWTMKSIEMVTTERVAQLLREGFKQRDIANELGVSVGKVNGIVRQVREGAGEQLQ